jgi:hypothetical protein
MQRFQRSSVKTSLPCKKFIKECFSMIVENISASMAALLGRIAGDLLHPLFIRMPRNTGYADPAASRTVSHPQWEVEAAVPPDSE